MKSHKTASVEIINSEDTEIPPVPNAEERGLKEIANIWRRTINGAEEQVVVQLRNTYSTPVEWGSTFVMLARTIITLHVPTASSMAPAEVDLLAFKLMQDVVKGFGALIQASTQEAAVKTGTEASEDIAKHILSEFGKLLGGEEGAFDAAHPGTLPVPHDVQADDGAQQILAVWAHPAVEDCEGCGEDHDMETVIVGNTGGVDANDMGILLAEIVKIHAQQEGRDLKARLMLQGDIEAAFSKHLNEDYLRA